MIRNIFFLLTILFLFTLVGCDNGGGDNNSVSSEGINLPSPIVATVPVIPDPSGGGGTCTPTMSFAPTSPLAVTTGDPATVVTVTGSPTGGTITLTNIIDGGTGVTFTVGAGSFTVDPSGATSGGIATVDVIYDASGVDSTCTAITTTYTVNVTAPRLFATAMSDPFSSTFTGGSDNAISISDLYELDPADGSATFIGSTGLTAITAIAFANGVLYATTDSGAIGELYSLNLTTGIPTLIGTMLEGANNVTNISGMTFDTSTSTMYVFIEDTLGSVGLATIDLATAAVSTPANDNDFGGIAYEEATDTLYALSLGSGSLEIWDRATGLDISTVGAFGAPFADPSAGDFHPLTGELYAVDRSLNLFTISTTDASSTLLGSTGISFIDGLAFER